MEIKNLSNGIPVIFDKTSSRTASIGFFVKAGSIDEDDTERGISHIIEHMTFKGTKRYNTFELSEIFDKYGMISNAFTSEEYTCYFAKCLPEHILTATDLYTDMIVNSVYDKEELGRELNVILEEYKMYRNNPESFASLKFNNMFMAGTQYGYDVIGTEESIKATTREKIMAYRDKYYCNENIVICVSGSFDEQGIFDYLEKNFELGSKKAVRNVALDLQEANFETVVDEETEQSYVILGAHTFGDKDPRVNLARIISMFMGTGMSSRLFKNIREIQGLAYSVGSMYAADTDTGAFIIEAGVSNDKVEQALKGIASEIKNMKEHPMTCSEFEKAKTIYKAQYVYKYESCTNRMREIGETMLLKGEKLDIDKEIQDIDNIKYEDVLSLADELSDVSKYSCLVYSNKDYNIKQILNG